MAQQQKTKAIVAGGLGLGATLAASVAIILGGIYDDEGGYVNHPNDPGGETNLGVTVQVAREEGYKGAMRAFPKQCAGPDDVCADKIYFSRFMQRPGYVPIIEMDAAVGEELVNTAVNMGPPRPSRWLQQSINEICPSLKVAVDGKVGSGTQRAFGTCQTSIGRVRFCRTMLDRLDAKQRAEYDRLVRINPSLKVFHRGWVNHRIGNVDRAKCGKVAA